MLTKPMSPRSRNLLAVSLLLVFTMAAARGQAVRTPDSEADFTSSNLPIVVINTHGQAIPDEPKIEADMGIIYNGEGVRNNITDPFNHYNGKIGIEIRGSSSQMFPKKQYAVETRDSTGADVNVSLLGLPAEADWVFSAPYNDKSLFRDVLSYEFARRSGRFASRAKFFELVLNNEYRGVYILLEKIKRNKSRVNITKMGAADTTGDALTGGYIVKIDKIEGSGTDGWHSGFPPYPGAWQQIYYQYHYPKPEDITSEQRGYVQRFIRDFELTMSLPGYADTATGYPRMLDVDSFVDFFLLTEFGKNVDGYRLSAFMYKDRDSKNPKLVMGPLWDFNHAFGNSDYYDASLIPGYQLTYLTNAYVFLQTDEFQVPFWWKRLYEDPYFKSRIAARWSELRSTVIKLPAIESFVDSIVTLLDESQQRNFVRWPVLGQYVWPNYFVGKTYQEEIDYLKNWVRARIEWMDTDLGVTGVDERSSPQGGPDRFVLFQNYPNPFNPTTTIRYTTAGTGGQGPGASDVRLSVYDVLGREVAMLVNEKKAPGDYEVKFDALGLASGVYIYRLSTGQYAESRTMVLMK